MRVSIGIIILLVVTTVSAQTDNPGELKSVTLIDGVQQAQMKDTVASRKERWGVVVSSKNYYVFKGPRATVRTKSTLPAFEFETDMNLGGPVYLFRLDRHSDRREIRVAKGFGGLAELTLPKDHIVEIVLEEIGGAPNSVRRYRLKPKAPLRAGEYCVSRRISVCYDFGVD